MPPLGKGIYSLDPVLEKKILTLKCPVGGRYVDSGRLVTYIRHF